MILALRELRRTPRRFVTATIVLTLLVVLLLFLGGLLDGLYLGSTGALRAQRADVIVYSADANDSIIRSRIDPALRARVELVPGVTDVSGLGITLVGTTVPGRGSLADTAVIGYESAPRGVPAPPPAGEAWADRRLAAFGVRVGQTLGVGPEQVPIRVRGWVNDTNYLLQGALWVDPATWRQVQDTSRPDASVPPGTFAVLAVGPTASAQAGSRHRRRNERQDQVTHQEPGSAVFAGHTRTEVDLRRNHRRDVPRRRPRRRALLRPADDRTHLALRRSEGPGRLDAASRGWRDDTGARRGHRRVRGSASFSRSDSPHSCPPRSPCCSNRRARC